MSSAGVADALRGDEMLSDLADKFAAEKVTGEFLHGAVNNGQNWEQLCATFKLSVTQGMRLHQAVTGGGAGAKRSSGSRVEARKKKQNKGHGHTFKQTTQTNVFEIAADDDDDGEEKAEKENAPAPLPPLNHIKKVHAAEFGLNVKSKPKTPSCRISQTTNGLALFNEHPAPVQKALGDGFSFKVDKEKGSYIMTFSNEALTRLREYAAEGKERATGKQKKKEKETQKKALPLIAPLTPQLITQSFKEIYLQSKKKPTKQKDEVAQILGRLDSAAEIEEERNVKLGVEVDALRAANAKHCNSHTRYTQNTPEF